MKKNLIYIVLLFSFLSTIQATDIKQKTQELSEEITLVVKNVLASLQDARSRVLSKEFYRKGMYLACFKRNLEKLEALNAKVISLKKEISTPKEIKILARKKKEVVRRIIILLKVIQETDLTGQTNLIKMKTELNKIERLNRDIQMVDQEKLPGVGLLYTLLTSLRQKEETYSLGMITPFESPWSLEDVPDKTCAFEYKKIIEG